MSEDQERSDWFNLTAVAAMEWLIAMRPELLPGLDKTMRALLPAMASFTALGPKGRSGRRLPNDTPVCYAPWESIGARCGRSRSVVGEALPRAAAAGFLHKRGRRTLPDGQPGATKWAMPALALAYRELAREQEERRPETGPQSWERRPVSGHEGSPVSGPESCSPDPPPEVVVGPVADATGAASAAAPDGASAAARTGRGASASCIAEIAERDKLTIDHVRAWTEWVLEDRESVRDPDDYVRWWRKHKTGPADWSPRVAEKTAKPQRQSAKAAKQGRDTAATRAAAPPVQITTADRMAAVAAVLAGATPQQVADNLGIPEDVDDVERWCAVAANGAA